LKIGDTIGFSIGEFWIFGLAGCKLEYVVVFWILLGARGVLDCKNVQLSIL